MDLRSGPEVNDELHELLDDVAASLQKVNDAGYMIVGEDVTRITIYSSDDPFHPIAEVFEDQTGITWEWM